MMFVMASRTEHIALGQLGFQSRNVASHQRTNLSGLLSGLAMMKL